MAFSIQIILDVFIIVVGFMILDDPYDYLHGFPVPKFTGYIVICAGIYHLIKTISERHKTLADDYFKCKSCGALMHKTRVLDGKCTSCGSEAEDLRGYFKKNQEIK
jgi:hypothetical protein